jgi:integrase
MPRSNQSTGLPGVSISERRDGANHFECQVQDPLGGRFRKRHPTRAAALKWAAEKLKATGAGHTAGHLSLADLGPAWIDHLRARGCRDTYISHCDLAWRALVRDGLDDIKDPRWGLRFRRWLDGLRETWHLGLIPGRTPSFRTDPQASVTPATRDKLLREVRSLINTQVLSVQPPVLTYDPTAGIPFQHRKKDQALRDTFTVAELRQLVSDDMADHPLYPLVVLCTYTGWRPIECAFAKWEWIDRNARVIRLYQLKENLLKTGERIAPLEPELADALDAYAKPAGWILADPYVRTNGSHVQHRTRTKEVQPRWTKPFARYAVKAGITLKRRTLYSLRHSFISIKLAAGTTENMVMGMVGHSNISTTLGYAGYRTLYARECGHWGSRLYLRDPAPTPADDAAPAPPRARRSAQ